MPIRSTINAGLSVLFLAAALAAQQPHAPSTPKFDVASIHPVPRNAPPVVRTAGSSAVLPGGQYVDSRAMLVTMIGFAYDVKYQWIQVRGLPAWASDRAFAVAAKPEKGFPALSAAQNTEQVRLMMRALLADRFHLVLHSEVKQERVYSLELAKNGLKINEVEAPLAPATETPVGLAASDYSGRIVGKMSTMASMAGALTVFMDRPVVDRTGLKGHYDFDVQWAAPESADAQAIGSGFGPVGTSALISTLQDRFGLRLVSTTGPVTCWVVDHVEPPSEN
jgi:Protein of unknown function (DUF3738).